MLLLGHVLQNFRFDEASFISQNLCSKRKDGMRDITIIISETANDHVIRAPFKLFTIKEFFLKDFSEEWHSSFLHALKAAKVAIQKLYNLSHRRPTN